jgi:hypothetical protein
MLDVNVVPHHSIKQPFEITRRRLRMLGGSHSAQDREGRQGVQRALVEAPVVNRLATETFEFVAQMQNAALEISYHQVISRRTTQSLSGLLFRGLFAAAQDAQYGQVSPRFLFEPKKKSGRATAMS